MSGPDFRFDRRYASRPRTLRRTSVPVRRKRRPGFRLMPIMATAFLATIALLQRAPDTSRLTGTNAAISFTTNGPAAADTLTADFGFCHTGGGRDCVVDGDTFWFAGEKYRIADIDTPETHPARCADEAALGRTAADRLREWLNAGAFSLEAADCDTDAYDRKLRIVTRGGASAGDALVAEGLARRWDGRRRPWC